MAAPAFCTTCERDVWVADADPDVCPVCMSALITNQTLSVTDAEAV